MLHASEQPPEILVLNDPHNPLKLLVCQKSQSCAMIFIVNNNYIIFQSSANKFETFLNC